MHEKRWEARLVLLTRAIQGRCLRLLQFSYGGWWSLEPVCLSALSAPPASRARDEEYGSNILLLQYLKINLKKIKIERKKFKRFLS
jgi:hypothetical protein